MTIANWLLQTARSWPLRPAIFDGDTLKHDYASLLQQVCDRAADLAARGIGPGDRVAIFARNAPDYIAALHAIWWVGGVVVPVNHKLHPREADWILDHSGATLVFTDDGHSFAGRAELALAAPAPAGAPIAPPLPREGGDPAWLFYTSGTTGRPKGVMLSHDNLVQMSLSYATDVDRPQQGDHMLYAAPMSHGAGLYMFAQLRAAGAHVVPVSRGFDSAEIRELARSLGGLVMFAAPTMVKRLIALARETGWDGSGVRTIIYGGGPMYAADIDEALAQFGARFVQIYGQGESPMTISYLSRDLVADTTHPRWRDRRASVGVAQGACQLAILGPDDTPLPAGKTGEICVRAPTVMQGYWQNPEASAETLRGGWLHTGDLGHMDADGFLYLTDRSKDVIISGGTNIYPREVEEVLLRHPAVFEVAVVGEPEPEWGEQVVAFVVFVPGETADPAALDRWCRDNIAGFKRPKRYEFPQALPKNSYGKVLKTDLRAWLKG
ncbi:class I adenylate-forming enzyme family protein [Gemmobacter sp.]|uniref:class I adenylate-forming enzyme family protein n=1 Tax=Gemmobacter sp. TaxID=1898957 RepID=UPI002AFF5A54|nr:AMP-binding protein [Gemmobacter sp.]